MPIDREKFRVEPDEDDGMSLLSLHQYLIEDTERKKNKTISEFEEMGDKYLKEIERKKKHKELMQQKLIPYILKHRGNIHDKEELMSYSYEDVEVIYNEVKAEKKSFFINLFNFLFNIEEK